MWHREHFNEDKRLLTTKLNLLWDAFQRGVNLTKPSWRTNLSMAVVTYASSSWWMRRVISDVCDTVCPRYKRKTAWAINTKLSPWRPLTCTDCEFKRSKVIKWWVETVNGLVDGRVELIFLCRLQLMHVTVAAAAQCRRVSPRVVNLSSHHLLTRSVPQAVQQSQHQACKPSSRRQVLLIYQLEFSIKCLVWLIHMSLSLIHIWRCRRSYACRSRWSPYH